MVQKPKSAFAVACANVALIKYWGKRNGMINLPAVGSISLTLEALKTRTRVTFDPELEADNLIINNHQATDHQQQRIAQFLNIIREKSGTHLFAKIISENNFPTAAGLASSASGFAALAMAAASALKLNLSKEALSGLSRLGSGSAARSIYGGIVEMQKGHDSSGKEDFAVQLAPPEYWDLRVLVLVTSKEEKKTGSTNAMNISAKTSPYYTSWVASSAADLDEMRDAIRKKDFEKLGDLTEFSTLKMHALTLSSKPPVIYWNSRTLELIEQTRELRFGGVPVYFTIDAGPQVKLITLPEHMKTLSQHFGSIPWIEKLLETKLGPDALLIGENH